MSFNTEKTLDIVVNGLEETLNSTTPWESCQELQRRAKELADKGELDDEVIRRLARENANKKGLDFERADEVFELKLKPASGSLAAMRAPSRSVWRGSGSCISAVGAEVVHYIDRPGIVEKWYGSGFPYIISKLVWMALASQAGHNALDNRGGYQYVAQNLRRIGQISPEALPHIGSAYANAISFTLTRSGVKVAPVISSASGTLPEQWVDDTYQTDPYYAARAEEDEAQGLFDGHIENRRAGLYDTDFAYQTIHALHGHDLNNRSLLLFDARRFEGVDIN